jgi:GTP cyclohydrolase I
VFIAFGVKILVAQISSVRYCETHLMPLQGFRRVANQKKVQSIIHFMNLGIEGSSYA